MRTKSFAKVIVVMMGALTLWGCFGFADGASSRRFRYSYGQGVNEDYYGIMGPGGCVDDGRPFADDGTSMKPVMSDQDMVDLVAAYEKMDFFVMGNRYAVLLRSEEFAGVVEMVAYAYRPEGWVQLGVLNTRRN